jgi:uncharacterized membrane protein
MEGLWLALQDSSVAAAIRQSEFIYPIANVMHVIAIMLFFAIVAAMDLALLNVLKGEIAERVIDRLRPWAIALFAMAMASGLVLFAAEALPISRNPAFRLKLALIVISGLNLVLLTSLLQNHSRSMTLVRSSAAVSLSLWVLVAALGRWIAYA